ncbi:MAG: formate dehydrogenase accessory sulfurtransferase FdhD [Bacteroidales bacterium]|nr:formate dehydrogenase accessory sulfurtransferase FdhD [Bacteroidales bacterium]
MKEFKDVKIVRFKNGVRTEACDPVVTETSVIVTIQCELLGTLTCTPTHMYDLVAGYLITSGIVWEGNKLINIDYLEDKKKYDVTLENNNILKEESFTVIRPTGCAGGDMVFIKTKVRGSNKKRISITSQQISALMQEFNKTSELFKATGGVHSSAISDTESIIVFREDIGRHNAVDKTIGFMFRNKKSLDDKILLSSGRISSEIVQKAINAGIQMIISRSAPTLKGIEMAEENDVTLIGFARSNNFNVYTHFNKVDFGT